MIMIIITQTWRRQTPSATWKAVVKRMAASDAHAENQQNSDPAQALSIWLCDSSAVNRLSTHENK